MSIYDPIDIGDPDLWIPTLELEGLLNKALVGFSLGGLPLRTRSKVIKTKVCEAMGYPVPTSFNKTQPRFPGQNLDIYTQKSRNLQIWNEEISPARRYAIIAVNDEDLVTTVKVVNGDSLAALDTTGTLTQKYQAKIVPKQDGSSELLVEKDTAELETVVSDDPHSKPNSPIDEPDVNSLYSISAIFAKLKPLVGVTFEDAGHDQERNRGALLHKLVCEALGYGKYQDNGQFPDIRGQLLEIKLQTSPTIDLGLVSPDSDELLDIKQVDGVQVKHQDVRYAVFYASISDGTVTITHLYLTNGKHFYDSFPQFQGKVINKKLQIPLPKTFFS